MKTAFKWFDIFLNLLLATVLFLGIFASAVIFIPGLSNFNNNLPPNSSAFLGAIIMFLLFISFIFGLLYIIIGVSLLIVNWKLKNEERYRFGKRIFLKGIIRGVLALVFFFLISLALSFFGVSGPDISMPNISNQNPDTYTSPSPIPSSSSNLTLTPSQ